MPGVKRAAGTNTPGVVGDEKRSMGAMKKLFAASSSAGSTRVPEAASSVATLGYSDDQHFDIASHGDFDEDVKVPADAAPAAGAPPAAPAAAPCAAPAAMVGLQQMNFR